MVTLEHWESYYRGGALATCPTGPGGSYDKELRDAWVAFFSPLPNGAGMLDIGTGNGAVVAIARELAAELGRDWRIHGADLAMIDPVRDVPGGARRFRGVVFHPGVATENLPFDDAGFDAVSGHYALEYADPARALAEIHRVLRPDGRAQFILHHTDSLLVKNALGSMDEAEFVLNDTRVYRRLKRAIAGDSADASRASKELEHAFAAIRERFEQARRGGGGLFLGVTLDAVQKLLALKGRMTSGALEREIDRAESELRASARRVHDLVGHALNDEGIAHLERLAVDTGFTVTTREPQHHAGINLIGWRLQLGRTG